MSKSIKAMSLEEMSMPLITQFKLNVTHIEYLVQCELLKNGLMTCDELRALITKLADFADMSADECEQLARKIESKVGVELVDY